MNESNLTLSRELSPEDVSVAWSLLHEWDEHPATMVNRRFLPEPLKSLNPLDWILLYSLLQGEMFLKDQLPLQ